MQAVHVPSAFTHTSALHHLARVGFWRFSSTREPLAKRCPPTAASRTGDVSARPAPWAYGNTECRVGLERGHRLARKTPEESSISAPSQTSQFRWQFEKQFLHCRWRRGEGNREDDPTRAPGGGGFHQTLVLTQCELGRERPNKTRRRPLHWVTHHVRGIVVYPRSTEDVRAGQVNIAVTGGSRGSLVGASA